MRFTSLLAPILVLFSAFLAPDAVASEHASPCARVGSRGPCVARPSRGFVRRRCIARDGRRCEPVATHVARSNAESILFARATPSAAHQEEAAQAFWAQMSNHVLHGRVDKPESGRHTTSSFFGPIANNIYAKGMEVDSPASMGTVTDKGTGIVKTMFIDSDVQNNAATNNVKKWSEQTVSAACKSAIKASFNSGKTVSVKSVRQGSYSVQSPLGGENICVHVNMASCWPLGVTSAPLNDKC